MKYRALKKLINEYLTQGILAAELQNFSVQGFRGAGLTTAVITMAQYRTIIQYSGRLRHLKTFGLQDPRFHDVEAAMRMGIALEFRTWRPQKHKPEQRVICVCVLEEQIHRWIL